MVEDDPRSRGGVAERVSQLPYQITFKDFLELKVSLVKQEGMISAALSLKGSVEDLTGRVSRLELADARLSGRTGAWSRALDMTWALLLAIVAGGLGYLLGVN